MRLVRPLVAVSSALCAGTALGLAAPAVAALVAAPAFLAAHLAWRRSRPGAAGAASLFVLAALRAALVAPGDPAALEAARPAGEGFDDPWSADPPARFHAGALRAAPGWGAGLSGVACTGRWALEGRSQARGRLAERGPPLAIEPGCLRPGEAVALTRHGPAQLAARGPDTPLEALWEDAPADELLRLAPAPGARPRARPALLERLRRAGLARLDGLPDPTAAGLHRALVFGDRGALDPAVVDLFTRTGTRHALALSGLHVGLLALFLVRPLALLATRAAAFVLAFLRRLAPLLAPPLAPRLAVKLAARLPRRVSPGLARAALVLAIVPLGGGAAPVARAAVALALAVLAPLPRSGAARHGADPGRRVDPPSLLALALALECLADPRALASPSLALSYVATAGLVLAVGRCAREARALLPGGGVVATTGALGLGRSPWWRVPAQRLIDYARITSVASLVAFLATLPLAWRLFGEVSPVGILATAAILPLLAALLVAGWAWTLLPGLVDDGWPTRIADAMLAVLRLFDALPGTPVPLPPRPVLLVAAGAWLWLWGARASSGGAGRVGGGARRAGALCLGLALLPWRPAPRGPELVALDVGHGTAVLLRTPGQGAWLFDAGSRDRLGVATRAVAPLLRRWEVGRLGIVASHADRDHVGALPWICERWPPELWAGAGAARCGVRLPHATPRLDLAHGSLRLAGARRGDLDFTLLRGTESPDNEGSRALLVEHPTGRLLLTGDAEDAGLAPLLDAVRLRGALDLLLLPHHGAAFPLLDAFLERTEPAETWVSGSGAPPAAGILARRGVASRTTAREGALTWRPRAAPGPSGPR